MDTGRLTKTKPGMAIIGIQNKWLHRSVEVSNARNQPPRGSIRNLVRELEEKIADRRRRQGSTEVSGERESENEVEDLYLRDWSTCARVCV